MKYESLETVRARLDYGRMRAGMFPIVVNLSVL